MVISEHIGIAAILEQCAEECAELGHAALKMARVIRGENPTPANKIDILNKIVEESADVLVTIEALVDAGLLSNEAIDSVRISKTDRWKKRIEEKESK